MAPPGGEIEVMLQVPAAVTPDTYRILFETIAFRDNRPMPPLPLEPLPMAERTKNSFEVVGFRRL